MATNPAPLRIGYAGSLKAHDPQATIKRGLGKWAQWFWTYRIDNIKPETRSGYFLFKGIEVFQTKYPDLATQLLIHMWGMIDPKNQQQAVEMGLADSVKIEGYKSKAETVSILATCDVLFLPLESGKDGQKPLFIPGKLYEYLKLGKPILALADESDCVDILRKSGLGLICSPYDAEGIADTLAELVKNRAALPAQYSADTAYIDENFNFKNITRKLSQIFDGLAT